MDKCDNIARLPAIDDDEYCSICGDDNTVLVLKGSTNCNYCGNQINLCLCCFERTLKEVNDIGVSDNYK